MPKKIENSRFFVQNMTPNPPQNRCKKIEKKESLFGPPLKTCLVSEREARDNNQTCRHVSPHAAEWRSLQLLVAVCRILSTLRALSSLRSLARCARHTIMQHLRVSVYLCVFGRVCMYLRVFARMCVYLLVFARICVYLRVFASICPHLHVFCASLRLCACICAYLCIFARIVENHVKMLPKRVPK